MKFIYRKHCCFYRKAQDGKSSCALNSFVCFTCPYFLKKIEGLDLQQHVNVTFTAVAARRGMFFAMLALIVSLVTLGLKITESFSTEIGSLMERLLGR